LRPAVARTDAQEADSYTFVSYQSLRRFQKLSYTIQSYRV
jgi:hypothetical protein